MSFITGSKIIKVPYLIFLDENYYYMAKDKIVNQRKPNLRRIGNRYDLLKLSNFQTSRKSNDYEFAFEFVNEDIFDRNIKLLYFTPKEAEDFYAVLHAILDGFGIQIPEILNDYASAEEEEEEGEEYEDDEEGENVEEDDDKNEHEENANENINIETGHKNVLNLNKENMNKRRRSIFSEHQNSISNKYNKLQSFSRQLSTESFLRAKTKGDKIIDNIPKHLGPKQISWGSGGQSSKINNIFNRTGSDLRLSSKYNHYLKKITEQAEEIKVKRLSVINEDELLYNFLLDKNFIKG